MPSGRKARLRALVGVPVLLALISPVSVMPQDGRAWISVCPTRAEAIAGAPQSTYETPAGDHRTLFVSPARPAGCVSVEVPVPASAVLWARLVSEQMAPRIARGFLLEGGGEQPALASEIIPLDDDADPAFAPAAARPAGPAAPDDTVGPRPRSMWVWQTDRWQSGAKALFAHAAAWNATVLYIAADISSEGSLHQADRLRSFLAEAAGRGLKVWAVEGDPRAVLESERPKFVARARALAAFNQRSAHRLAGIQYDIEPYLVPGYSLQTDQWLDAYAATIEQLKAAAAMPVEVAVPFWWVSARSRGGRLMDRLAPSIDSVAVMDYRTDQELIERFARPWLEWGETLRKPVRIALEAGRIADNRRFHFRPAETGTIWSIRIDGAPALMLLRTARPNPAGPAFAAVAQSMSDASAITFFGRTDRLREMLPGLEQRLSAFRSFAGLALHEVPAPDGDR